MAAPPPYYIYTMASVSLKYQVFRARFHLLVNLLKSNVGTVARKAFASNLITSDNMSAAENRTREEVDRASKLLAIILSKVEEKDAHFETFVTILEDVPVLRGLAGELREAVSEGEHEKQENRKGGNENGGSQQKGTSPQCDVPHTQVDCQSESTSPPPSKRRRENSGQDTPDTPIPHYALYLKGVYKSATTSTDKFPHLPCSKYTNLALVKKERFSRSEADTFTKATLHGDIDEILQKKEPITMEELLNPTEGQPYMKCIFMEGAPGIGKSTCVWELCRRWDEIDALRKYSLVILLRLREKRVQEAQNVADLCYHEDADLRQAVAAEIKACEGRDVLFILDGFDELPASLQKQSMLVKLICGTYLSQCTVLVTSRPSATADLLSVAQLQIHKQIEVVGFTQENVEAYARASFASQTDVLDDFLKYLSTYPAIRSLMYIPLSCAMTVEIYRGSHGSRTAKRPIPQTMTQLYAEMSLMLLKRYLDGKDDPLAKKLPRCLENLPPQLKKPFSSLAKLAFEGMVRGEVIFDQLPAGCNHFGFMNSSPELYMGELASMSHSFLHLTLQEFLTAFSISQLSPIDQKSVFGKHGSRTAGWDVVWRFVAGLSGFRGIGWEVVLSRRGRDKDGRVLPFFVRCLYEAQEKVNYDSVLGESEVEFYGGFKLMPFSCYCLGHCVAHSKCKWRLDMSGTHSLGDALVEMLKHGLQSPSKSPPQEEHANILLLNLSSCYLTSTGFNHLADIIPLMTNLKELNISENQPGNGGLVNLLHSLSHLKSLQTLDMYNIYIECTDIEALSHLISPSEYLKNLTIGQTLMSSECTELMFKTVLSPSSLESVLFCEVFWSDKASALLEVNNNLTTVRLIVWSVWCNAVPFAAKALHRNSHLKQLLISWNISSDITDVDDDEINVNDYIDSDVILLSEMLEVNQTLERLELRLEEEELTADVLLTLNDALQCNHTLKELELQQHNLKHFQHLTLDPRITFKVPVF